MTGPKLGHNKARGHERFAVKVNGKTKIFRHHRLLALMKHTMDELKGKIIHHRNGVPWDNRLENLELMTQSEHATEHSTKYSKEDCEKAFRRFVIENGTEPSVNEYKDWRENGVPSYEVFRERYGSWTEAKDSILG